MKERYSRRGVSADKEDVHYAIENLDKGLFPRAFCKILPDFTVGDPEYCILMHADGAGTKSSLAYLYWKETGDLSVWKGIVQDAIVMNLDDMLCAGATNHFLISNTIGRNAFYITKEVLGTMLNGIEEFAAMLNEYSISLISTGGETADVGDLVRTVIFDATVYTRMPRKAVISNEKISPGDVIVGLSSFGTAVYESTYNSGIGSNGLTNARHDVLQGIYSEKYPESFDPQVPGELVYSGKHLLTDSWGDLPLDIGKSLLSPTRTYLPLMRKLLERHHEHIHGLIHCTGGGQTKCLKFVDKLHVIKDRLFDTPPVFRLIQSSSGADWQEMYKVFNMGHRLEIYTTEPYAQAMIDESLAMGIDARIIGYCEAARSSKLTIRSPYGEFIYT